MTFSVGIHVTLRPSILDPQGKAAMHALTELGFGGVDDVRIGKYIALRVSAENEAAAGKVARGACEKLLANQVMEDFTIEIEPVS